MNSSLRHRRRSAPVLLSAIGFLLCSGWSSAQVTWSWSTVAGTPGSAGSEDSPGLQAKFYQPHGIIIDPAGNFYVADRSNHVIRKITPAGVVSTIAGQAGLIGSTDGTGGAARFSHPLGIARDGAGNLYVADSANNMIRKISPAGAVTKLAGQTLAGYEDATGAAAKFSAPTGVAVDGTGNVFVTDSSNHLIRKIAPGGAVSTFAGQAGVFGIANGTGTSAQFRNPSGIAIDATGNLYVTEFNSHTIRKITPAAEVTTLAGQPGVSGASTGTGNTAAFYSPTGIIAAADGTLYVADCNNNMVRKVTAAGVVTNIAGLAGSEGAQEGQGTLARFNNPYGITIDLQGNLFVADRDNALIRRVTPTGQVFNFAGTPLGEGHADSTGPAARFNNPRGMAMDATGNLYVADYGNHTIRKISPAGVVTTVAGLAGATGSTDGTGSLARFSSPSGMSISEDGTKLVVADQGNSTIRALTLPGMVVSTLAGSAGAHSFADGNPGDARFNGPRGISRNPTTGAFFVADPGNNSLRRVGTTGIVTTVTALTAPGDSAVSANGQVYITGPGNHVIHSAPAAGGSSGIVLGTPGSSGYAEGQSPNAKFNNPNGITANGLYIYVADTGNHAIRTFFTSGTVAIDTVGGWPTHSGSGDGIGKGARFNAPHSIMTAPNGDIYVADSGNHRIVRGKAYGNPWLAWLAFHGITSGAAGDEDGDGVANLLEFAFSTHPRSGVQSNSANSGSTIISRGLPSIVPVPGGFRGLYTFLLQQPAGLAYTPQFSHDLQTWYNHTGSTAFAGIDAEVNLISVPFPATLPNGHPPRFFRVRVEMP